MSTIFRKLKRQFTIPTDPYPVEAYKACPPNVGFPIEGIVTSPERAAEALIDGTPLIGCKVFDGATLHVGDIKVLRGKTLLHLFLDYYRNLRLVKVEHVDGDVFEVATSFFQSHELVISYIYEIIKLSSVHYSKSDYQTDLKAILQ